MYLLGRSSRLGPRRCLLQESSSCQNEHLLHSPHGLAQEGRRAAATASCLFPRSDSPWFRKGVGGAGLYRSLWLPFLSLATQLDSGGRDCIAPGAGNQSWGSCPRVWFLLSAGFLMLPPLPSLEWQRYPVRVLWAKWREQGIEEWWLSTHSLDWSPWLR